MATIIKTLTIVIWLLACYFMLVRIEEGHCKKDVILKSIIAVLIVLTGVLAFSQWIHFMPEEPIHGERAFHYLILIGLVFGALGDIRLGQAHSNRDKMISYRKQGIVLFALQHVMVIAAALSLFDFTYKKYAIIPVVCAVAVGLFTGFGARRFNIHFGRYTVIVAVYVGILCLDAFMAWGLLRSIHYAYDTQLADYQAMVASEEYLAAVAADPNAAVAWVEPALMRALTAVQCIAAGGLAFLFSDASLAPMYFGKVGNKPHYVIFNHVTYYFAQLLLAYSLFMF